MKNTTITQEDKAWLMNQMTTATTRRFMKEKILEQEKYTAGEIYKEMETEASENISDLLARQRQRERGE